MLLRSSKKNTSILECSAKQLHASKHHWVIYLKMTLFVSLTASHQRGSSFEPGRATARHHLPYIWLKY